MRRSGSLLLVCLAGLVCAGCGKVGKTDPGADAPRSASAVETVVEGLTGQRAVRAGKTAAETIRSISSNRNNKLDQILP